MSLPSTREELVGKRFLCVCTGSKLKISKVAEWPWKSGLIRCASHLDPKDPDLQVQPKFLLFYQSLITLNTVVPIKFPLLQNRMKT